MNVKEEIDLHLALRREVERLAEEFRGTFSLETIERCAQETYDWSQSAPVRQFVPPFAYRYTRERLQAAAHSEGLMSKDRPEVLFVCVQNAGRSQMAAALTQQLSGGQVDVRSAGSQPADRVNPAAVEAMAELGLDLSQELPKPLVDEFVRAADVVITMGCGDACPIYPGKRYEDWELDDPAGQSLEKVREIRDNIRGRVERLLEQLGLPAIQ